jgi:hypothetical protein
VIALTAITYNDIFKSGLDAEIDSATSATTQCANDENSGKASSLSLALCNRFLDIVNQQVLVFVRLDAR